MAKINISVSFSVTCSSCTYSVDIEDELFMPFLEKLRKSQNIIVSEEKNKRRREYANELSEKGWESFCKSLNCSISEENFKKYLEALRSDGKDYIVSREVGISSYLSSKKNWRPCECGKIFCPNCDLYCDNGLDVVMCRDCLKNTLEKGETICEICKDVRDIEGNCYCK